MGIHPCNKEDGIFLIYPNEGEKATSNLSTVKGRFHLLCGCLEDVCIPIDLYSHGFSFVFSKVAAEKGVGGGGSDHA